MRFSSITGLLAIVLILGCGRSEPAKDPAKPVALAAVQVAPDQDDVGQQGIGGGEARRKAQDANATAPAVVSNDDKYESALAEGLTFMADQKWSQALLAFETARTFNDSEFVRGELAKLRVRVEQENSAQKTVSDIEKILEEGRAPDAAKLAQQALREFGDGDSSAQLVKLRLQADALAGAAKREDDDVRYQRYREEAETALRDQNLRAAALAYEQALQARNDPRLQQQLDDVRGKLENYDNLRRRAYELRRDPQQLEDALAALQDAAKLWDTLQVRQDIDACQLALQKRRDNLAVADFEARGSVGFADAGRTVAEELLPHFKSRFDLVERGQIGKVIQELKLEDTFDDDPDQQRELARLAKVRYLVLGSISRLSGVTVSARLVDARSGLVVQTGKVTAPTIEQAIPMLPALARQLLMSDEEKMLYDQQQAQVAQRIAPPPDDAPLPPPPAVPAPGFVPPPAIVVVPAPPVFVGVTVDHYRRFPAPPVVIAKLPPPPPPPPALRHRILHAELARGDELYRHGRHAEAHRHFEFALSLSPGDFDLHVRLGRVRPHLPPPPPPVVIVDPTPPVVYVRHRVAILDFATFGRPHLVPPGLGHWTAEHLAPYFRSRYDVVDASEVYWYMGRLGMTMRDLLEDPHARRWLARAVGVRYFVVGHLVETASFDANTYMLDAEFGYLHSSASVHVHNPMELKLRLGELAQFTMLDPAERARMVAEAERFNTLVLRGRQSADRRDYLIAIGVFEDALKLRPNHVEVMFHLTNARRQADLYALEEARRQQYLRHQAFAAESARRQMELVRAAEAGRIRAAHEASFRAEGDRRALEEQRLRAHQHMLVQARVAIKTNNFSLAFDFFKGAAELVPPQPVVVGFTPQHEVHREMALARVESERASKVHAAQAVAAREAALRQQRELELAKTRQRLAQEHQARVVVQKKSHDQRDDLLYQASFDEGQRLMAAGKYDGALSSLQAARRVKSTPAVEQMIKHAVQQQALASAKNDGERKRFEAKLAAERENEKQAEQEAKRKQGLYQAALASANQALAQKQYAAAEAKFEEAGKLYSTDAVLTGLRRAQAARAEDSKKAQAEANRTARVKQLLAEGRTALNQKDYADALKAFQQARKMDPDNVEAATGLTQAEQAHAKHVASAKRQVEDDARDKQFQRLLQSGQANLQAKQFAAAETSLREALKLRPGDKSATAALVAAEAGQTKAAANVQAAAEAKKRSDSHQKLMADGRQALQAKRYDDAIRAFSEAQKVLPGDQAAAAFLKDAQQARSEETMAIAAAAKKRADDLQRDADFQRAMIQAQKFIEARDYKDAIQAYQLAAKIKPGDPRPGVLIQQAQKAAQAAVPEPKGKDLVKKVDETKKKLDVKPLDEPKKKAEIRPVEEPKKKAEIKPLDEPKKEAKKKDEPKKKAEPPEGATYQQLMAEGQKAMKAKNYDEAVKAFAAAARLMPGDPVALQFLKQAQKLNNDDKTPEKKKKS